MTATTNCANCGHRLAPWDKFCSQCGQDTANHPPSLWEFTHEFVLHYIAFEGKLWKSLWALLARPGFLTAEYLEGRKQRYVLPLRLILTLGLVFFLVLKLDGDGGSDLKIENRRGAAVTAPAASAVGPVAQAASGFQADRRKDRAGPILDTGPDDDQSFRNFIKQLPKPVEQAAERSFQRFKADGQAEWVRVKSRMLALAPYMVLASLPLYAGLLALIFWSRRQPFGAHFVFAMHLHAAWYLVLIVGQLPHWSFVTFAVFWACIYPVLALKRVYDGRWWVTLARAGVLLLLHAVLCLIAFMTLFIVGALFG